MRTTRDGIAGFVLATCVYGYGNGIRAIPPGKFGVMWGYMGMYQVVTFLN